jgi:hypothetical protein
MFMLSCWWINDSSIWKDSILYFNEQTPKTQLINARADNSSNRAGELIEKEIGRHENFASLKTGLRLMVAVAQEQAIGKLSKPEEGIYQAGQYQWEQTYINHYFFLYGGNSDQLENIG